MSWRYLLYQSLLILRNLLLLILCLLGINYAYSWFNAEQLKRESSQFVNLTFLPLFADWQSQGLVQHADEVLQHQLTTDRLNRLDNLFQHLQGLVQYQGASGYVVHHSSSLWRPTARYQLKARFEYGEFAAVVSVVREWGEWKIDRFYYEYNFYPFLQVQQAMQMI